jgi:uncharacterized membrane protein
MTALIFAIALVTIFVIVLIAEQSTGPSSSTTTTQRSWGLLTWLSSGNWPAKLGAILLVIGFGALLRYALVHIELPPQVKLAGGIALAAALGLGSFLTGRDGRRPSISLALGGTTFGVAYLTAYSAYAYFDYVTHINALALLGMTSIAAALYAGSRHAISVAILAMLGAFLAPAFALGQPGPTVVLSYYLGASLLVLALVVWRGWRALMHMSFIFTLAGSTFFAWTHEYYQPEYFDLVSPWLLALLAIHLAMAIAEQRGGERRWLRRIDRAYLVAMPVTALTIALTLAPDRRSLAPLLGAYSLLWLIVAGARRALQRDGVAAHVLIGIVFAAFALAAQFEQLPWELLGLALVTSCLALSIRSQELEAFRGALAGAALLFGALHVLDSIFTTTSGLTPFLSGEFGERFLGGSLLIGCAYLCRRAGHSLTTTLSASGAIWLLIAVTIELVRFEWLDIVIALHLTSVVLAIGVMLLDRRMRVADAYVMGLIVTLLLTALNFDLQGTSPIAWLGLIAAPLACLGLALRREGADSDPRLLRPIALTAVPASAAIWTATLVAAPFSSLAGLFTVRISACVFVGVALATLAIATRGSEVVRSGADALRKPLAFLLAALLLGSTCFDIERSAPAVILELLCLAGLVYLIPGNANARSNLHATVPASIIGMVLIVQATLLRLFGPPGQLDITDLFAMRLPALISLIWAAFGAALTIWSVRIASRTAWLCGAVLLVATAVKVILVDFGSLGQLANIVAVIAAGGMFMLVGWLAPMPPAKTNAAQSPKDPLPTP